MKTLGHRIQKFHSELTLPKEMGTMSSEKMESEI